MVELPEDIIYLFHSTRKRIRASLTREHTPKALSDNATQAETEEAQNLLQLHHLVH